ncbi:FAD-dependent oxidoreductase [bacterium]|nr:FAD-dependent oxidoreductase [bacterium]MBU1638629.1 FAD-dependent oxidoreductase [bacterium]MBU1921277.1 FAD-dependent oxidoreductase [bacterium]
MSISEKHTAHNGDPQGVLVIGGGIAGIQAALDIADSGYRAYLVEKTTSLGGRMAQLDKTFPTIDCSI